MKILLADDHPLFLEGLRNLLASRGIEVAGTARNGFQAIEKARELRPDVILMDIQMPGMDGLAAMRLIKAEIPEVKIVMLTMSAEEEDLFEAINGGACGYLLKTQETDHFFTLLAFWPDLLPGVCGSRPADSGQSKPAAGGRSFACDVAHGAEL